MTEETIEENQNLYVIGEAFRVGDTIHIGKPEDKKKPFIVTTKSEEDLINKSNQNAMFSLVGVNKISKKYKKSIDKNLKSIYNFKCRTENMQV